MLPFRAALCPLILVASGLTPLAADAGPSLWDQASDRLFDALAGSGDPTPLADLFGGAGDARVQDIPARPGIPAHSAPARPFFRLSHLGDAVSFDLFLTGMDAMPAGFILEFSGDADQTIPGLRGALSNCSEVNQPDCDRLGLTRRSDITLGVAACLCHTAPQVVQTQDGAMILIPCYLGRGGTYLDWIFGFGPADARAAAFIDGADARRMGDLCAASEAARTYPQFLTRHLHDEITPLPDDTVDPQLRVGLVLAADGPTLAPAALMPLSARLTGPVQ